MSTSRPSGSRAACSGGTHDPLSRAGRPIRSAHGQPALPRPAADAVGDQRRLPQVPRRARAGRRHPRGLRRRAGVPRRADPRPGGARRRPARTADPNGRRPSAGAAARRAPRRAGRLAPRGRVRAVPRRRRATRARRSRAPARGRPLAGGVRARRRRGRGAAGADRAAARALAGGYDWREHEARINEHEQALVHGLHVLKAGSGPRLVLMNGWPSTVAEYLPALPLLADFEVWIVSRLGYGFSERGLDQPGAAEHAATLVGRVLGAGRYAAHGDDFGGSVLSRVALQRPEHVAALHVCEWLEDLQADDLAPAELAYVDG